MVWVRESEHRFGSGMQRMMSWVSIQRWGQLAMLRGSFIASGELCL